MSEFKITKSKGFQITFDNGWTVSVQFGPYNYCEGYEDSTPKDIDAPTKEHFWTKPNAEIAAWNRDEVWYHFEEHGDEVLGYQSPNQVLEWLNKFAAM